MNTNSIIVYKLEDQEPKLEILKLRKEDAGSNANQLGEKLSEIVSGVYPEDESIFRLRIDIFVFS